MLRSNGSSGNSAVYVEWSDEVWNWSFGYLETQDHFNAAVAEVNAGNSPLNYDGTTNQGTGYAPHGETNERDRRYFSRSFWKCTNDDYGSPHVGRSARQYKRPAPGVTLH